MSANRASRREFLRLTSALSFAGSIGGPLGLNLAAIGSAAAQSAPPTDYRALVCVFLFGGNDTANMVLPTDADSWARYQSARNQGASPIALMAPGTPPDATAPGGTPAALGGVLPIVPKTSQPWPAGTVPSGTARTFALHPQLPSLQSLFASGQLAILANVGTLIAPTTKAQYTAKQATLPRSLFSHNDQQSEWQAGAAEGARIGWGGQFADALLGANSNPIFTAISTSGNAVMLAGQNTLQYQVAANGVIGINGIAGTSLFGAATGPATLNAVITAPTQYTNPVSGALANNPLAIQLQTVSRIIAANQALGARRQVFFVSIGGFDTHASQNAVQPILMAQINHGLNYFYSTLTSLSLQNSVTAFTMSEFARTFTTNGLGTDHAWGSHHMILGGAVKGGDIYNQFPTVGVDLASTGFNNPDAIGSGDLIPTVAVDQYAATLGSWFGASPTVLSAIFPNLVNFSTSNLGFV